MVDYRDFVDSHDSASSVTSARVSSRPASDPDEDRDLIVPSVSSRRKQRPRN